VRGRWIAATGGWLAAAVLTTTVAVTAVNSINDAIFDRSDRPLSERDVTNLLAESPSASPNGPASSAPPSQPAPQPSVAAETHLLRTDGGTIVASCSGVATGAAVTLHSWSPVPGFQVDHLVRGPASVTSLRFKARRGGGDIRVQVACSAGTPRLSVVDDD
jgi:hypothetical protein